MELRPGYKHSEVGVIPEEWEVRTLGELGEALIGLTFEPADIRDHGTLVLRSSNIQNDVLAFDDAVYVETAIPERIMVRQGDVLVCVRNGSRDLIGKAALLDERTKGMTFGAFMAVYRSPIGKLARYFFQSPILKRQIDENLGATINQITNKSLTSFLIPYPPSVTEREAVVKALGDLDALLGALDGLIAKKRDLKQGAMQQLLTGQTRLPGFCVRWERRTLGGLGNWFSGGTPSKADETLWAGEIPWVSPKDMKIWRLTDAIDHVGPRAIGNGTRLLPTGAILVVVRGMILAHSAPVTRAERPVCFNQDIKGLVVRSDVDSTFVLWWLVAHESLLLSLTNEATHGTKRIPTDELMKLEIGLPLMDEQSAIAAAITDMDAEVTALVRRRDKTRDLKQAMMQELLTGRTRLV